MNNLYKHHNYTNKNYPLVVGSQIYEYDIESAGFNLLTKYNLIDKRTATRLSKLNKVARQRAIGNLCRKNKELTNNLNLAFIDIRKSFFEANQLQENQVYSIKKDAVFTFKPCVTTQFDNVNFRIKNIYNSALLLNNLEIYSNKEKIDVKGISDQLVKLHENYMCDLIHTYLLMMENSKKSKLIKFMMDVNWFYKNREFPVEMYREFNRESRYRWRENEQIMFEDIGDLDMLDIRYNYLNVLIPLQNYLI